MKTRLPTVCFVLASLAVLAGCVPGCIQRADREVVVYCALDREFSQPIFDNFTQQSGITVSAKYDVESTKTVGLVTAILNERERPRCDLFWNNEILHTLRLQQQGLLEVYLSPAAEAFPGEYHSETGQWYGFAARARVLIINTDILPDPKAWPNSIEDLADQKWSGRAAIAKPLFGTTATHAAVLFSQWGEQRASEYYRSVKQIASIEGGNKQVATSVSSGQFAFGITDTDDAIIEKEKGNPVAIVFPDQGKDEIGTLFIPNSICLIRGSANQENARQLVDHLLSPQVESRLAEGPSAQFPVGTGVEIQSRIQPKDQSIRWMTTDFGAAAAHWDAASRFLRETFHSSE